MHDRARLAPFHSEVRVARTISRRNVCRTYDIRDAALELAIPLQVSP
jgi:hypothetical protein